jgi:hypothetical protein
MSEKAEIFHTGKDDNDNGSAHHIRQRNGSVDDGGSPIDCIPVLPVQKDNDTMQHLQSRPELAGSSGEEGIPFFAFKRESDGAFIWPVTNDQGHVVFTSEGTKTKYKNNASLTPAALDTEETVMEITLGAAGEKIEDLEIVPSSFKDNVINVYHVDDSGGTEVLTLLMTLRVKGGSNDQPIKISCLGLDTTGGTNVQAIRFRSLQQRGDLSPLSIFACAKAE